MSIHPTLRTPWCGHVCSVHLTAKGTATKRLSNLMDNRDWVSEDFNWDGEVPETLTRPSLLTLSSAVHWVASNSGIGLSRIRDQALYGLDSLHRYKTPSKLLVFLDSPKLRGCSLAVHRAPCCELLASWLSLQLTFSPLTFLIVNSWDSLATRTSISSSRFPSIQNTVAQKVTEILEMESSWPASGATLPWQSISVR